MMMNWTEGSPYYNLRNSGQLGLDSLEQTRIAESEAPGFGSGFQTGSVAIDRNNSPSTILVDFDLSEAQ
jgi:hypothetical protein